MKPQTEGLLYLDGVLQETEEYGVEKLRHRDPEDFPKAVGYLHAIQSVRALVSDLCQAYENDDL